jgi:hypothetical protein
LAGFFLLGGLFPLEGLWVLAGARLKALIASLLKHDCLWNLLTQSQALTSAELSVEETHKCLLKATADRLTVEAGLITRIPWAVEGAAEK